MDLRRGGCANKLPNGIGIFTDDKGSIYSGRFNFFSSVDNNVKCQNRDKIQFGTMVNGVFKPSKINYTKIKTTKTYLSV